jgi:hypothetical protein
VSRLDCIIGGLPFQYAGAVSPGVRVELTGCFVYVMLSQKEIEYRAMLDIASRNWYYSYFTFTGRTGALGRHWREDLSVL